MKAERRHELQANTLAATLTNAPEFLRQHGAKVLLVIIVALLIAIFIHQRTRRTQEQLDFGWTAITAARMSMDRIANPAQMAAARKQLIDSATQSLASVVASDNPQIAAQAYLLRGDLNWTIANLPDIPEAATQPSLKIEGAPREYLTSAKTAYTKVIRAYPEETQTVTSARFGLAAIAENEHDFAAAQKIYTEIKADPNTLPAYKTLADLRLTALDIIKNPVYVVPTTRPAVAATTIPAATVEKPATAPAR